MTTDEHQPPLAGLSEEARADALVRWSVLRPHLEDGVPLARAARDAGVAQRTAQRWLNSYRADGLAGLARAPRRTAGCAVPQVEWRARCGLQRRQSSSSGEREGFAASIGTEQPGEVGRGVMELAAVDRVRVRRDLPASESRVAGRIAERHGRQRAALRRRGCDPGWAVGLLG